jgi:hypothetical protein
MDGETLMKLGKLYKVEFWDHANYEDDDVGPVRARLYGQLIAASKLSYEFELVGFEGSTGNMRFSVLRSTVIKAKELK